MNWQPIHDLHRYFEEAGHEMDVKITKAQNDILRLQTIYEGICQEGLLEPKENIKAIKTRQAPRKFYRGFDTQQDMVTDDSYASFLTNLAEYKKLQPIPRSRIHHSFIQRILDYSRMTPSHYYDRLPATIEAVNDYLDEILKLDLSQPSSRFKFDFVCERAEQISEFFEKMITENGLRRRVDVSRREIESDVASTSMQKVDTTDETFETIGNMTLKQLHEIYKMRGNARQSKLIFEMKKKVSDNCLDLLKRADQCNFTEQEGISLIKSAARLFEIVRESQKHYAVVVVK